MEKLRENRMQLRNGRRLYFLRPSTELSLFRLLILWLLIWSLVNCIQKLGILSTKWRKEKRHLVLYCHQLQTYQSCSRAPFDRSTMSGYFMYFIIQFFLLHCYYAGLIPCFSFFVGTCYYMSAACDELAELFESVDAKGSDRSEADETHIRSILISIVQLHIKVIE